MEVRGKDWVIAGADGVGGCVGSGRVAGAKRMEGCKGGWVGGESVESMSWKGKSVKRSWEGKWVCWCIPQFGVFHMFVYCTWHASEH